MYLYKQRDLSFSLQFIFNILCHWNLSHSYECRETDMKLCISYGFHFNHSNCWKYDDHSFWGMEEKNEVLRWPICWTTDWAIYVTVISSFDNLESSSFSWDLFKIDFNVRVYVLRVMIPWTFSSSFWIKKKNLQTFFVGKTFWWIMENLVHFYFLSHGNVAAPKVDFSVARKSVDPHFFCKQSATQMCPHMSCVGILLVWGEYHVCATPKPSVYVDWLENGGCVHQASWWDQALDLVWAFMNGHDPTVIWTRPCR